MIDRKARDAMSDAIQAWMDGRIGSFKFDDTICDIASKTEDRSVRAVRAALWSFYSDTEDHKIRATKQQWDLLNRIRLILASDVETDWYAAGRRWDFYKTLSALCLAGLVSVVLLAGFGKLLIVCWALSGFLVLTIFWLKRRSDMKVWAPEIPIIPVSFSKVSPCRPSGGCQFRQNAISKVHGTQGKIALVP